MQAVHVHCRHFNGRQPSGLNKNNLNTSTTGLMRGIKILQQDFALKMRGGLCARGVAYLRDTKVYIFLSQGLQYLHSCSKALNKLIISQHEGMRCDDSYSMCISTSFNILFGYANLYRKALEMIVHEQGIDTMPFSLLVSVHVFTRFEVIFTPLSKTVWQDCISFVLWPLHELNTT